MSDFIKYEGSQVLSGELAGSTTSAQLPDRECKLVNFKAASGNAGNVYIGSSGVTIADGVTDITTGFRLGAGEETGWIPCINLKYFYRICDNAGDSLTYMAIN